jgi:hypothetical protein
VIKWKLMITTLPFVVVSLGIKLFIEFVLERPGFVEFSEVGLVLTGGVFLIGFMLAGVMADYKESEKMPGELACTLETIEEIFDQAVASKPTVQAAPLKRALFECVEGIRAWLLRQHGQDKMFAALTALDGHIQRIEREGAGGYAARALSELHNLRKTVTRIGVISRTGFLASGYALLEVLVTMILIMMMVAKFKTTLSMCILVPFVTLIYVYMLRLIKDVDDPFEYSPGGRAGAAEVELFPFEEYRERLTARVKAGESAK